nr:IS3 family transposase [Burkholderia ambifaria]
MKKSRFSEEQIIGVLKEADAGMKVADLCRKHGISDATFYNWRSRYGGMDVSEARRLRQLEEENQRLKRLVADQALDIQVLKDVPRKKVSSPAQRREVVQQVIGQHDYSERRACALIGLNRRTFRRPVPSDADHEVRQRLRELAQQRPRFGSPRLHVLLCREGLVQNHKRTERLYREEGLSLRLKRRKKRPSHLRVVMPTPAGADESWSMDFVADALVHGRRIRMLTIIDTWNRECPHIEVDFSPTGVRVARVLEQLRQRGRRPNLIQVDNGPEFVSKALDAWAHEHGVKLQFIRPGKPVENAHIESFNGRLREECLNQHAFVSLDDARRRIEAWRTDYNSVRPHSALGQLAPDQFRQLHQPKTGEPTNLQVVYSKG